MCHGLHTRPNTGTDRPFVASCNTKRPQFKIASRIVKGKIRNQLNLMKFYARSRKENTGFQEGLTDMENQVERLSDEAKQLPHDAEHNAIRDRLFSIEGRSAAAYWAMVKHLLAGDIEFAGRRRQGADDLVNSMLNYGYGILYSRVWRAIAVAGLNPFLSFLHAPQKNKPTLSYDLIEEFRCQAVDRAVFTMITRGEELKINNKTRLLTDKTKEKVIENVLERLASIVPYKGSKITLTEVIRLQPRHLIECLKKGKAYRPFIGRY
ncbi:MAG: CRISPR-associated endonuclease Cas1 [Thermodesulfobacteriota bacterium]|nr:CRISPR-associated endonuclease Cas1 [Thermodesulfobacteriota bacterium]